MTNQRIKVGFWKSDREPTLPFPEEHRRAWTGSSDFLKALKNREAKAGPIRYRGWSTCRICQCMNGSVSYTTARYEWPQGLSHYVEAHNVRLPQDFVDYIMGHRPKGEKR